MIPCQRYNIFCSNSRVLHKIYIMRYLNRLTYVTYKVCFSKHNSRVFDFGLKIFLEAYKNRPRIISAKSIFTLILKVSDKFVEKCRRSRLFGEEKKQGTQKETKQGTSVREKITQLHALISLFYILFFWAPRPHYNSFVALSSGFQIDLKYIPF